MQYSYGYGGVSSGDFFIRGFQTNGSFRDGFRDFGFLTPLDVASTERIEFLKGPASVLYGNLITLLPNLRLMLAGRFDYVDSLDHYRPSGENHYADHDFLPQVGLVYQPWTPVSVFGGWTRC